MVRGENGSSGEMDDRPKIRDHRADNKQHAMVDIGEESDEIEMEHFAAVRPDGMKCTSETDTLHHTWRGQVGGASP